MATPHQMFEYELGILLWSVVLFADLSAFTNTISLALILGGGANAVQIIVEATTGGSVIGEKLGDKEGE